MTSQPTRHLFRTGAAVTLGAAAVIGAVVAPSSAVAVTAVPKAALPRSANLVPPSVTPETYGAHGDGVHDDTAALQRALNAAAATGAKVQLAANRTYRATHRLLLPSHTTLAGAGPTSVLAFTWTRNDATHDGFYLGNTNQAVNGPGNSNIRLHGFKVLGAGNGLPAGLNAIQPAPLVPAIRLRQVNGFTISHVEVSHAAGINIIVQGVSHGEISYNYLHDSGRDGVNSTWQGRNLHDVLIAHNTIRRVGDDGVAVIGETAVTANTTALPYNVTVRDNLIQGWRKDPNGKLLGRGIAVIAATHVIVSGNTISHTDSHGILVTGSTRSFSKNPATGLPWRSSNIDVAANRVSYAGGSGIVGKNTDRLRLTSNTITSPRGQAVYLTRCTTS